MNPSQYERTAYFVGVEYIEHLEVTEGPTLWLLPLDADLSNYAFLCELLEGEKCGVLRIPTVRPRFTLFPKAREQDRVFVGQLVNRGYGHVAIASVLCPQCVCDDSSKCGEERKDNDDPEAEPSGAQEAGETKRAHNVPAQARAALGG